MQTRKPLVPLVAIALIACWAANAQESAHEIMTGGRVSSSATGSVPVLAYGGDHEATFPPKTPAKSNGPRSSGSRMAAYCVRSCDGRYFPAPSMVKGSLAEGCNNLCPASETQVFYGSTIDGAYSQKGQAYSALSNAFRYRKELVAGCTCNGKDVVGLAHIEPEDDGTLRQGDLLATAEGMTVVRRIVNGEPRFAEISTPDFFR